MSTPNPLAVFDNTPVPAYITGANLPAIPLANQVDSRNRIAFKNGRFVIKAGNGQERALQQLHLDVVIVGAHDYISRIYYEGKYAPGMKARPVCFSSDGNSPSRASAKPQSAICASCPQNQKGSAENNGKACGFFKRLVVMINGKGSLFIIDAKSQSIFGTGNPAEGAYTLNEYSKLLATRGYSPASVVTRITFDPAASVSKVFFTPVGFVSQEMMQLVNDALQSGEVEKYKEIDLDTLGDEPGAQPQGQPQSQQAAPTTYPVQPQQPQHQTPSQPQPDGVGAIRNFGAPAGPRPTAAPAIQTGGGTTAAGNAAAQNIDDILNNLQF